MSFLNTLPPNTNLLHVFKAFPHTSKPLLEFHEAVLRGPSPFSDAERELIAAYVSALNRCRYCRAVHTATAERLGIAHGLVEHLIEDFDCAPLDSKMKPVLRYAHRLTRDVSGVTDADAKAVFAAGWDEGALHALVAVTALFNLMNRLLQGLRIEAPAPYVEQAPVRVAPTGVQALLRTPWPSVHLA